MVASRYILWFVLAVPGLFVLHGCGEGDDDADEDAAADAVETTAAVATTAATTTAPPSPAPTPAPTPVPTMDADGCMQAYFDVGGQFNSCNPEVPSTCEGACTAFETFDVGCPAETFDGLGFTACNCDCGNECDCDNCPAEYTEPQTKERLQRTVMMMCGKCGPAWQAIGDSCGDDTKDTCAAYETFQAECTEEEWAMLGMTNCNCDDCDHDNCPEEYLSEVTYADIPNMVTYCNNGAAC